MQTSLLSHYLLETYYTHFVAIPQYKTPEVNVPKNVVESLVSIPLELLLFPTAAPEQQKKFIFRKKSEPLGRFA